jgi:two-component system, chemotaxis family, CheB/CheR fusion protein
MHGLRSTLQAARKSRKPARKEGLRVRAGDDWVEVDLEVIPLPGLPSPHFLVMFEERHSRGRAPAVQRRREKPERVGRLEEELASTREYLQSIIQEVEAANEELQSTNEELDTAKEELQSTNEELNTLSEELHSRNDELTRVNSDLINLLASVQIAIVIVSTDLRIRRFTPMAEKMLNLIPSDIGRPITQLNPNIDVGDLGGLVAEVVDRVEPLEREVRDRDGRWFALRIRPYKGIENRIDGAVVALFDVDSAKRQELETERTRQLVRSVLESQAQPIAIVDGELRIRFLNQALCETFQIGSDDVEGRFLYELRGDGSMAQLRSALETVARERRPVDGIAVRDSSGNRALTANARPVEVTEIGDGAILVAFNGLAGSLT